MDSVYESLVKIVGQGHVSNQPEELYIYSYDLGTTEPHRPDYVVSPRTTEQIQAILKLANEEKAAGGPAWRGAVVGRSGCPFQGRNCP